MCPEGGVELDSVTDAAPPHAFAVLKHSLSCNPAGIVASQHRSNRQRSARHGIVALHYDDVV